MVSLFDDSADGSRSLGYRQKQNFIGQKNKAVVNSDQSIYIYKAPTFRRGFYYWLKGQTFSRAGVHFNGAGY